ncbi:hypothetical protein ACNKHV_00775 [Shigella flexneri]
MLIIGGGDGATPRKVTRHKNFSQSRWWKSMRVSLFCRHYVPNHNAGSYDDRLRSW